MGDYSLIGKLLLLRDGIAQGVPYTATITDLLCFPICALIISHSPTRALS
jgi:hypothetical protein